MEPHHIIRFWSYVTKTKTCWLWNRCVSDQGYGKTSLDGQLWLAHRLSWTFKHGPVPEGMCICHRCDVPACVRPSHLFLGTHADNTADMIRKGRESLKHPIYGERNGLAKLTEANIIEIRRRYTCRKGVAKLAQEFGIRPESLWRIANRKAWQHIP
jgi:hypothetical protein